MENLDKDKCIPAESRSQSSIPKQQERAANNSLENNMGETKAGTTTTTEDWSTLSQWIQCMCIVTFDLNLGQALEFIYPKEFMPSEQEVTNICYMAFPDSNSGCMGDTKFHMRLRMSPDTSRLQELQQFRCYNSDCPPVLKVDQSHYWGFVYFRQKRDANLPRGYFQKSFIIVTRLPFFNLFYEMLTQLAQKYFDEGEEVLIKACQQINSDWPQLQVGGTFNLPLFDQCYQILVPRASSRKAVQQNFGSESIEKLEKLERPISVKVIASVNEVELFHSLSFIVDHMYTLWELVLTAEPIVVVGTSPADCSHMVQTLVALIAPLEYCAEARPYFTIHDSEFKEFTRECGKIPPPLILGVTNPFFIKLLKDWPHMLRLVDNQLNMQKQQQIAIKNSRNTSSVTSLNSVGGLKTGNGNSTSLNGSNGEGSAPGLYTKYKPFLKKDKSLIKKVLLGLKTKRPEHVQTALLRRHLLELTQSFMIPLERYMASLMPLQKDISPFKSAPNANAFKLDDFLATLELSGPHLTSPLKGDWKGLYRRFYNSPNFRGWYESRHKELQLTLQDLQLQALSEANLEQWARDKQEVEIIDMILKLKQKLNLYNDKLSTESSSWIGSNGNTATTTRDQIRAQINCMKELLPNDLKNVVNI
ncbi:protein DENND6B [Musca domestica]|uniref:Protein DENND6B n=1 Tax=Musca domestica TaxID=7370 RepID=A0A9J7D3P0_MUSDO|nr:protein DENND6B [Musca domestica]